MKILGIDYSVNAKRWLKSMRLAGIDPASARPETRTAIPPPTTLATTVELGLTDELRQ